MVEVFLRRSYDPNIMFKAPFLLKAQDYEKVAEIDSDELVGVYHITQNLKASWLKDKKVKVITNNHLCRSSSIGDVFSLNGELHLILPFGYKMIKWGDTVNLQETTTSRKHKKATKEVAYFRREQSPGVYHYYKVVGGPGKTLGGYQEGINFLNKGEPMLFVEHNDISSLTGTWCQYEVGEPISKKEYDKAYWFATKGDFSLR